MVTHLESKLLAALLVCSCAGGGGRADATSEGPTSGMVTMTTATPTTSATPTTGDDSDAASDVSASGTGGSKFDLPVAPDLGDPGTTGECAAQTLTPEVQSVGVDVLVVVDTSNSMQSAIAAVEASINVDFAAVLENSGVDYRIIVMGDYPPGGQLSICITAPLSSTDCNPPPVVPAVTERYKHYDASTGSGDFLNSILAWYSAPDPHGLAPGGYQDFLRPGTRKVILAMTDGTSAAQAPDEGVAFDAALLALNPANFGTPGDRQYLFHTIITMAANDPPSAPWLAQAPIQGEGGSIQQVSVLTGGWRFPLSQVADFDVLFQEIAKDVVATTPIACSFPIPEAPMGMIDPDTIEIDYKVGGVDPAKALHQVVDAKACEADAFYIVGGDVYLCPQVCDAVQADPKAELAVRYGCDVGFDPAG